ncbi:hypothetical protein ZHAS_00001352 [Anopheles sinensis]|uniref:Peptidase S1 domain-containing protein n=1 Tax=Anopheles sinensis TaxID=74873 RepID=A0A084VB82_ANOSI|nr:hypothetical protein ZHAS_00001352 [Anopheles sinensis]
MKISFPLVCEEYRKITVKKQTVLPLAFFAKPIELESNNCTNVVQLIAGGEPARKGEFPHHALLGFIKHGTYSDYEFKCGGTLISNQHVLTAAHCFKENIPKVVRLGAYSLLESYDAYDVDIEGFLQHPSYKPQKVHHDIALVKLANRVFFTSLIRPACLWDTEQRNISRYIATGFGSNESFSLVQSTELRKVQLEEFPIEDCVRIFIINPRFRDDTNEGKICVGSNVVGRDTCQGDSGGPLQTVTSPTTCTFHIVGITATGGVCAIGNGKAMYTKVSHYIDWIEKNVWGPNPEAYTVVGHKNN